MTHKHSNQWLQKYHPSKIADIIGNVRVIRSLKEWIQNIQRINNTDTLQNDTQISVPPITFLYGPGGIGKSCIAETVLKHFNYHVYELNAGEIRSKKRIQNVFERIMNNYSVSMMQTKHTQRTIGVIMDEIDGMSCGDKGGLHELFHIIKQNKDIVHPVICISNRPYDKKISSELYQEFQLRFPTDTDIHKRLRYICKKEHISIDDASLHFIIKHGKCDIRRTIHFLQEVVYSSGNKQMDVSISDIQSVIEASSTVHNDFNIFDATRDVFNIPLTRYKMVQSYSNDKFLMSIMIYENLPEQLIQKKLNTSTTM
ncbi:MAG TPA: AAA family ATPase, partial [Flavobacteriales bacterium]|nr:AAA family ATPase [Flavobacteriales bacterium]